MVQYLCQKEGKRQLDTPSTAVCVCRAQAYLGARARHINDRSMTKQTINGTNSNLFVCRSKASQCNDWVRQPPNFAGIAKESRAFPGETR